MGGVSIGTASYVAGRAGLVGITGAPHANPISPCLMTAAEARAEDAREARAAGAKTYGSHEELFERRPGWRQFGNASCSGMLVIDPGTQDLTVWTADCDVCGETIGIPPAEQKHWLARQTATSLQLEQTGSVTGSVTGQRDGQESLTLPDPPDPPASSRMKRRRWRKGRGSD